MTDQLMILGAGPYRSDTNDDPVLIQRNVEAMEDMALVVFRRGDLPVLGEWFALPLLRHAGSTKVGDAVFDEIFHPIARELIGKCDAVLRIGGPSTGRQHGRDGTEAPQTHLSRSVGDSLGMPPILRPGLRTVIVSSRAQRRTFGFRKAPCMDAGRSRASRRCGAGDGDASSCRRSPRCSAGRRRRPCPCGRACARGGVRPRCRRL